MEAIILAGGFGTRLKNKISDVPKPMAPIRGVPFLSYILDQLNRYGFKKVVLAVGFLHEKIIEYYGYQYKDILLDYSIEDEPLGTGGCVKNALKKTSDDYVFIINGDTYFDVDFTQIIKPLNVLIVCKYMENTSRYGKIVTKNNKIIEFSHNDKNESGYINGGIYYIDRTVFKKFDVPKKFSMEKEFFEIYLEGLDMAVFFSDGYFIDIGIEEDYERAENELQ